MTIRTLSFRTSLILAGAALTASMAFAESERYDKNLGEQTQGSQYQAPFAPDTLGVPAGQLDGRSAGTPMVSAITPQSGEVGIQVSITGANLGAVTKVLFGGSSNATFQVISDSEVRATVPRGAYPGVIELDTPSGNVDSSDSFLVAYQ